MKIQSSKKALLSLGFGLALLGATPAFADKKGEDEKAEKDLDKAEKGQKKDGKPGQVQGQNPFENPLEKILDLMKGVEERLFDADTGDFTQDEQKKIVEAMRFEDKTKKALDELIDKIENSQQQSSSSSSSSKDQQQKDQKKNQKDQKNQRNQQQKSKAQQEREKELERQRQAQREQQKKQQQKNQEQNQAQKKKQEEQQKKNQSQKDQKTAQQPRNGRPPEDKQGELDDQRGASGRWGNLPAKLFQDAANVRNRPTPSRYRRLIERYRERISGRRDR